MSESVEREFVTELAAGRRPRTLYHYTSPAGLLGILQSKAIWASSIHFLNDSTEYSFALELARRVIEELMEESHNAFDQQLYRVLVERLETERTHEVYVSSFTENADQLSQWRAYCPPTGGYAVGFKSKFLVAAEGSGVDHFLVECLYDKKSQERLVRKVIDGVASFSDNSRHAGVPHDRVFRESFKLFGRLLPAVAPVLKHSTFSEEDEWRLVHLPMSFENIPPRFREGRSMLIPYHLHSFTDDRSLPIEEVVIGPTPHPPLAREAVENVLLTHGIAAAKVRLSSVPFRTW